MITPEEAWITAKETLCIVVFFAGVYILLLAFAP